MKNTSLFTELKNNPKVIWFVIIFHLILAILLGINLTASKPDAPSMNNNTIDAVAVDIQSKKIIKELPEVKPQPDKEKIKRKHLEEEKKQKQEKEKRVQQQRQQEQQKKEQERLKEVQQQKIKKAEEEKQKAISLAKKKAEEKLEKEKLAKENLEQEKLKKQQLVKEKLKKEKLAKEKLAKEKVAAEKKRLAEQHAELQRELLEEEAHENEKIKAGQLQSQRQQYVVRISQKVEANWLRPVNNAQGQSCDVVVLQTMQGMVIDVRLQSCHSDDAFQRSVIRAVQKASPLPLPPNADVFDREIHFTFKPH